MIPCANARNIKQVALGGVHIFLCAGRTTMSRFYEGAEVRQNRCSCLGWLNAPKPCDTFNGNSDV